MRVREYTVRNLKAYLDIKRAYNGYYVREEVIEKIKIEQGDIFFSKGTIIGNFVDKMREIAIRINMRQEYWQKIFNFVYDIKQIILIILAVYYIIFKRDGEVLYFMLEIGEELGEL